MHISAIIWTVGDFEMNGLIELTGLWKHCRFWVVWVRILFNYIFACLITLRFYALDRIFIQGKPYKGLALYAPVAALSVILLGYCLVCQFMNPENVVVYVDYAQICMVNDGYRYASVGLLWIPWITSLILVYRLRKIKTSFNELYETLFTCCLGFLILVKSTVVHATHPYYVFSRAFRQSETLIDCIGTNLIVWIMLVYPAYQCMFRRDAYDREWAQKLRTDGYLQKYSVEFDSAPFENINCSNIEETMFERTKMGNKIYYDKDPMHALRMLVQNGGDILRPATAMANDSTFKAPAASTSFQNNHSCSIESFDLGANPPIEYPRRII
ncbi:hypothetical protein LPJ66_003488 [Kickxella alabastrina]|uniref:Uncharacterized protein n=1 Tax=Kickxella alabastrina TaxID=61397 RepID=A0ACC1IKK3_9FUNG|nr:hypothetical protein LPJ66_003488 [Kickxella alabastrina]